MQPSLVDQEQGKIRRSRSLSTFELTFYDYSDQMVVNQLLILSDGCHQASRGDLIHFARDTSTVFVDHADGGLGKDLAGGFIKECVK